ncbi:MAG: hypothetical protein K2P22_10295 [Lachnospiraceae bacterium]|nr:hypothetical protein [Lachnospiraceae bacterium]
MDFFKKRSPSFWIIVTLISVAIFLFAMGFRITYSPTLENSWSAIDAVGGWVSALGAIMAVVVALVVANRQNEIARNQNEIAMQQAEIAEQQNRIALFEKRFEFYNMIQTCITIGHLLPSAKDAEAAISLVAGSFNKGNYLSHVENDKNVDYIKALAIDAYDKVYEIMGKAEFIFEFETLEYVSPLVDSLLEIVTMNGNDREQRYHRVAFSQYSNKVEEELLPHIRESLMQMKR